MQYLGAVVSIDLFYVVSTLNNVFKPTYSIKEARTRVKINNHITCHYLLKYDRESISFSSVHVFRAARTRSRYLQRLKAEPRALGGERMDVRKLLFEPMVVVVLYFSLIPSVLISCDVLRWCATFAHIMGSNPTCA